MSQSIGKTREGFVCPQCHQDMSNMEMLQTHLQTVHNKQSSTVSKGLFSFAKQKIKSVQGNFKTSPDPLKIYAQYFSLNSNENSPKFGYACSHNDSLQNIRKNKLDQILARTRQTLLRIELLTNTNETIPRNGNTKERLKYEQNIVLWMEDSVASICASCSKSFGLFGRKHHCRLDGYVICNECSRFISFSIARWIIELNAASSSTNDEITRLRLNNLIDITSSVIIDDGTNEDYLRICLPCGKFLQKHYDKIRFRNIRVDEIFHQYDKIVQAKKECHDIRPTYLTMIDSLLKGETTYQIVDAQRVYQQLNSSYDKIDSTSRSITKLADSSDADDKRYVALCRNIRTYSMIVLQTYSISTKRVPSKDDIKRIRDERAAKLAAKPSEESKSPIRQCPQAIRFVRQDELAGNDDEINFLVLDFK